MSSRSLPDDYFAVGVFAADGPELLHSYTCVSCGIRHSSWKTFRVHRGNCLGHMRDGAAFATRSAATAVKPAPEGVFEAGGLDLGEVPDETLPPESPYFLPVSMPMSLSVSVSVPATGTATAPGREGINRRSAV